MRVLYFFSQVIIFAMIIFAQGISALVFVQDGSTLESFMAVICMLSITVILGSLLGTESNQTASVKEPVSGQNACGLGLFISPISSADIFRQLNRRLTAELVREVIRCGV